jgi:hypothetical protein
MEETKIFGKLFDNIPLSDENHLDVILNTLTPDTAMYIVVQALNYGLKTGMYTFAEAEILSKSLRCLTKKNND